MVLYHIVHSTLVDFFLLMLVTNPANNPASYFNKLK